MPKYNTSYNNTIINTIITCKYKKYFYEKVIDTND